MMKVTRVLWVLLLGFAALAQGGSIYRWVDGHGRVHYSDQPQGDHFQNVDMPSAVRYPHQVEQQPESKAGHPDSQPKKTAATEPPSAPDPALSSKNCQIARNNLQHNERISRMYRLGADGTRQFLTAEERAAVLEKSRAQIKNWCG